MKKIFLILASIFFITFSHALANQETRCLAETLKRLNDSIVNIEKETFKVYRTPNEDLEIKQKKDFLFSISLYMPEFLSMDDRKKNYTKLIILNKFLTKNYSPGQIIGEKLNALLFELANYLENQEREIKTEKINIKFVKFEKTKTIISIDKILLSDGYYLKRIWDNQCNPFWAAFNENNDILNKFSIFKSTDDTKVSGQNFTNRDGDDD